ncbi:unnamed protein product [Closterium sp. Naga37s-1]|nr:unnamed protein product [Closterium sp. Naga37s-1]
MSASLLCSALHGQDELLHCYRVIGSQSKAARWLGGRGEGGGEEWGGVEGSGWQVIGSQSKAARWLGGRGEGSGEEWGGVEGSGWQCGEQTEVGLCLLHCFALLCTVRMNSFIATGSSALIARPHAGWEGEGRGVGRSGEGWRAVDGSVGSRRKVIGSQSKAARCSEEGGVGWRNGVEPEELWEGMPPASHMLPCHAMHAYLQHRVIRSQASPHAAAMG